MTTNLIILSKKKLVGIDGILPILLEIKKRHSEINVIWILISDEQLAMVKQNYGLWAGIQSLNPKIYVLKTKNYLKNIYRLLHFLVSVSLKRNIIIKDANALPKHDLVMRILKKFSRVKEIKTFMVITSPARQQSNYIDRQYLSERRGRDVDLSGVFNDQYDYFLTTLTGEQLKRYYDIDIDNQKLINAGYPRKLPAWREFLQKRIQVNPVLRGPEYFLYVLTYTGRRHSSYNEPPVIEVMEESLRVLKKYNSRIRTVFKPSAITDIEEVKTVLEKVGYQNYIIDYGHPITLVTGARFVFGNLPSTVMTDAYYYWRPVVEYSCYDEELFERLGRQSYAGPCCDYFIYRDKEKLAEVLEELINNKVDVARDPYLLRENFPAPDSGFYEFWGNLLTK